MIVRSVFIVLTVCWTTLLCFVTVPSFAEATLQPIDKVIAVVNNEVITQQQLAQQLQVMTYDLQRSQEVMPTEATLKQQVLQQLILQKLQLQLAKKAHIKVTDPQIKQTEQRLAAQNQVTVQQFIATLTQSGLSERQVQQQFRYQQIIQQLIKRQVVPQIQVTHDEVDHYLKKYKTHHREYHLLDILLPSRINQQQATQQVMQLKNHADWRAMLKQVLPKATINDLGWRQLTGLPRLFINPVIGMQVNDIVGPINAVNGLHLLKLLAIRPAKTSLTTEQAQQVVFQQKLAKAIHAWQNQLRASAYIKIY